MPMIVRVLPTSLLLTVFPSPVPAHNRPRAGTAGPCNNIIVEVESTGKGVLGGSFERCAQPYTYIHTALYAFSLTGKVIAGFWSIGQSDHPPGSSGLF